MKLIVAKKLSFCSDNGEWRIKFVKENFDPIHAEKFRAREKGWIVFFSQQHPDVLYLSRTVPFLHWEKKAKLVANWLATEEGQRQTARLIEESKKRLTFLLCPVGKTLIGCATKTPNKTPNSSPIILK